MKPKFKKPVVATMIAATLLFASTAVFAITNFDAIIGIISREPPKTIGTYVADGKSSAMLILQENYDFALRGSDYISYMPTGKYRIENGKLFLTIDGDDIIFLMEKDRLIFESGTWLEYWVEKGTVFHLTDE
jgi:hypothetical protein